MFAPTWPGVLFSGWKFGLHAFGACSGSTACCHGLGASFVSGTSAQGWREGGFVRKGKKKGESPSPFCSVSILGCCEATL